MLMDREWSFEGGAHLLKLGAIFTAQIKQRGGDGIYARRWIAVLNGQHLTETPDLDYAKGMVECEIVTTMANLSAAYRVLKNRAPADSDLYPDGAWARWKARQKVG